MSTKFLFAFLFICYVRGNDDFKILDSIRQEEPCIEDGGICTIAADCPPGHLSDVRGLCPLQKAKDIECCYGISLKETRCEKHGGVCVAADQYCNPQIVFNEATDCQNGSKCCILLR